MEELLTLREYLKNGRFEDALLLIDELEEMSREDKLNKIYSHAVVLLVHLMKRQAERRTNRSWDLSIYQAADQIKRTNRRQKSGGWYANRDELQSVMEDAFDLALRRAAFEAFEGQYSEKEFGARINKSAILDEALSSVAERTDPAHT
jgi:hypothetical protein